MYAKILVLFQGDRSLLAGLSSAVGNMSDCGYISDCRSRGHEFDPGSIPVNWDIKHQTKQTVSVKTYFLGTMMY